MKRIFLLGICLCFLGSNCTSQESDLSFDNIILGIKPTYSDRRLHIFVENNMIITRIWIPEIDKKFVPQGLTIADDFILLAGYSSLKGGPAQVKVFKINPENGKVIAQFKLPKYIHHGDGLAYAGNSILWLVDNTGNVLKIDSRKAFQYGNAQKAILGSFIDGKSVELSSALEKNSPKFKRRMRTHFCTYDGKNLWLGRWARTGTPKIYKIDQNKALLKGRFDQSEILDSFKIAHRTQGAAWDGKNLWLSQGGKYRGGIQKIDQRRKGVVLKHIPLIGGAEDIEFTPHGTLWISFEAGAMKYRKWNTYFPLIIQLKVD